MNFTALVNPGQIGTPHTHQIVYASSNLLVDRELKYYSGGNSFRPDMEPVEYDLVKQSTCTSCTFSEVWSKPLLMRRDAYFDRTSGKRTLEVAS